jgi:hypothetical protein
MQAIIQFPETVSATVLVGEWQGDRLKVLVVPPM